MNEKPLRPHSILVVEDSEEGAQSLAELLILCGHAVRVATCGTDALAQSAAQIPDVVLLDIGLPGMSGWELAAGIRTQSAGKQPFIIAVTGYGTEADRRRSADAGIDLHLVKPADPTALLDLLSWVRENLSLRAAVSEVAERADATCQLAGGCR